MTRTRIHAVGALAELAAELRSAARSGEGLDRASLDHLESLWQQARAAFPTIPPLPAVVDPRTLRRHAEAYQAVARRYA